MIHLSQKALLPASWRREALEHEPPHLTASTHACLWAFVPPSAILDEHLPLLLSTTVHLPVLRIDLIESSVSAGCFWHPSGGGGRDTVSPLLGRGRSLASLPSLCWYQQGGGSPRCWVGVPATHLIDLVRLRWICGELLCTQSLFHACLVYITEGSPPILIYIWFPARDLNLSWGRIDNPLSLPEPSSWRMGLMSLRFICVLLHA